MGRIVFDASALLAFLFREPGMERVKAVLSDGVMSSVNQAEVITTALRRGGRLPEAADMLSRLPIELIPFAPDDACRVGSLWPVTKEKGLSLGDRCCLALGMKLGLPVLTADREWTSLHINIQVDVIR